MNEGVSSGSRQLPSLVVRLRARCCRMSKAGARAFATGVALSGVLTISSTAPALLEGASLGASDPGSDGGSALRVSTASLSTPPGLIVEYDAARRDPDRSAAEPYGDVVPFAVRTPLADEQLFREAPALVVATDQSSARAPPHKISTPSKSRGARVRKAASPRVSGCSQCLGPIRQASPRRGNLFASLVSGDFLRNARLVRRGNRPSGVAQQQEAPRLTVWSFRRT